MQVTRQGITSDYLGSVEVFTVAPGSLIVLRNVDLSITEVDMLGELTEALAKAAGHEQFVVLNINDTTGSAEVIGPEELRTRLSQALAVSGA